MAIYFLISGQDIKKRLIRRAVYSFAHLRLFLAFQRRGCVARAGFAAMQTLYFRTRWRIRIVSTVFCLRCAYIFSNHSGHAWPYVGKVLHNKIDVYVRLSSAKNCTGSSKRIQSRRLACAIRCPCEENLHLPVRCTYYQKKTHCTCTFKTYTVTQPSKRKRCLCADNLQFCASCRIVEHKFNPCAQNLEFSCVS